VTFAQYDEATETQMDAAKLLYGRYREAGSLREMIMT